MEVKKGNSIIELTVVIGLISLLSLAISAIMLTTITSSNRIRRLTHIKQSGDYALTQIQTAIRNSRQIVACDSSTDTLSLQNHDGGLTDIFLEESSIASNSGIHITPDDLEVSSFSISCEPSADNPVLIKFSFDITNTTPSSRSTENSTLHFETTTNIRNE